LGQKNQFFKDVTGRGNTPDSAPSLDGALRTEKGNHCKREGGWLRKELDFRKNQNSSKADWSDEMKEIKALAY